MVNILPLIHFGYFPEIVNTKFFVQSYNDVANFKTWVEFLFHALTFTFKMLPEGKGICII